jgi:glutathione S-transferase
MANASAATLFHFPRSLSSAAAQVVWELELPVDVRVLGLERGQFVCAEEPCLRLPTGGMGLIGPVRSCPTYREMGRDASEAPLTLVQCTAIIERMCDLFDNTNTLRPVANSAARARHLSLMVFAEATFFPVVQFLSPQGSPNDGARERMRRERFCGLIAPYLVEQLDGRRYMFGDEISACDFLMGMPCLNNAFNAGVLATFPSLGAYFERLRERDSFARAHGEETDQKLGAALGEMVMTAHHDQWDFAYRSESER